jgi:acetyl esterase/lipase
VKLIVTGLEHIMQTRLVLCSLLSLIPTAALAQEVVPLWAGGAPGFEQRRNEPEVIQGGSVRNVHNPSITVYLPPSEKATGAAVVVVPGGGHRQLVFTAEGTEPATFLTSIGVAAFVLKHRLAREENSPYAIEQHAREDGYRAMRLVRSRAQEWRLDPQRIGIMGFSAGGEVVSLVAYASGEGDPQAADPVDRVNGRPNFQIMIYPGPIGLPDVVPPDAPPALLIVANDDRSAARSIASLFQKYRDAGASVEAHVFARGGHGFNMGNRSRLVSLQHWPQRLADWMADNYILDPSQRAEDERREQERRERQRQQRQQRRGA